MAVMLVSVMEGIIFKCAVEMGSVGMIYLPSFMKVGAGVQVILRFFLGDFKGCNVGITDGRDL
jgi:hypothetical protein